MGLHIFLKRIVIPDLTSQMGIFFNVKLKNKCFLKICKKINKKNQSPSYNSIPTESD